jgi:hypothetical protein
MKAPMILMVGIFLGLFCSHPTAGAATRIRIDVKLLDANTGRPYVGRDVQLFGTNATSGLLKANDILFELHAKTGADGVARFDIAPPLPRSLLFTSSQAGGCGGGSPWFVTEEVVRAGVVVPSTCSRKSAKFRWQDITAQPGEIVVPTLEPRGP